MKKISFIFLGLIILLPFCSFGQYIIEVFPPAEKILDKKWKNKSNFFPIATLDCESKGIKNPINIMYVHFDPSTKDDHFENQEHIDQFSFKVKKNGKLVPLFKESAFKISERHLKYFKENEEIYLKAKEKKLEPRFGSFISPDWWQYYPNGDQDIDLKPFTFICEIELLDYSGDDCKLYVFFNKEKSILRYIYQRT